MRWYVIQGINQDPRGCKWIRPNSNWLRLGNDRYTFDENTGSELDLVTYGSGTLNLVACVLTLNLVAHFCCLTSFLSRFQNNSSSIFSQMWDVPLSKAPSGCVYTEIYHHGRERAGEGEREGRRDREMRDILGLEHDASPTKATESGTRTLPTGRRYPLSFFLSLLFSFI